MSGFRRMLQSRWLMVAAILVLLAGASPYIRQIYLAGAIQNAVEQSDEITLNHTDTDAVPDIFREVIQKSVEWYGAVTHASEEQQDLYYERFTVPFRGSRLTNLEIYDPKNFDEQLCGVIRKCRSLHSVRIVDWGGWGGPATPPESSWRSLCEALRDLPHLENTYLGSPCLTDDALIPLAGHPALRRITVSPVFGISPDAVRTFASIPNLKELSIEGVAEHDDVWTEAAIVEFRAALPGVTVNVEP